MLLQWSLSTFDVHVNAATVQLRGQVYARFPLTQDSDSLEDASLCVLVTLGAASRHTASVVTLNLMGCQRHTLTIQVERCPAQNVELVKIDVQHKSFSTVCSWSSLLNLCEKY